MFNIQFETQRRVRKEVLSQIGEHQVLHACEREVNLYMTILTIHLDQLGEEGVVSGCGQEGVVLR